MGNFDIFSFSNVFAITEKLVLHYKDISSTLVQKFLDNSH